MTVLENSTVESLGWALLHFLWQGSVIYFFIRLLLAAIRRRSVQAQYFLLCGGMLLMSICPLATLLYLWPSQSSPTIAQAPAQTNNRTAPALPDARNPTELAERTVGDFEPLAVELDLPAGAGALRLSRSRDQRSGWDPWRQPIDRLLPWLVGGWMFGVCLLSLRLLAACGRLRRLRYRSTQLAPRVWQERLAKLSIRMRIRQSVTLVESVLVEVPTVIGWLKPLILLPATAVTGLDARQLESLLAHELAHVRRHDYLVNLLQAVLETLLFYHPAVWWISRQIRRVREECCDELAIAACGDHLTYVRALATMEELRTNRALTLAADGSSLASRIRRIVRGSDPAPRSGRAQVIPSGAAIFMLVTIGTVTTVLCCAPWQAAIGNSQQESQNSAGSELTETNAARGENEGHSSWPALLAEVRSQESRYRSYSAKVKTTRQFQLANRGGAMAMMGDGPSIVQTTSISQQSVQGEAFHFAGEDIATRSAGEPVRAGRLVVFDGRQTLAIEEQNSATIFAGRAEPPQMMPPHSWGIFHLAVNFPLSVYLGGTEALQSHPKVGRHPREAGSVNEFYKVESEIAGEETVAGLDCIIVLVKRWYYTNGAPFHQYLWLAKDRNYHVAQTRTASLRGGQETPRQESRVKQWRQLAEGLWLPEVVEVFDISPASIDNQTTETVIRRLTLEDADHEPTLPGDFFRLPVIPADLPRLKIDAQGHLAGSPRHPLPLSPSRTTSLPDILDRLLSEERKYESCEATVDEQYAFLSPREGTGGVILSSRSRQRYVIRGDMKYASEERESTSAAAGKATSSQIRADDGKVLRTKSTYTRLGGTRVQAMIDLAPSNRPWRGIQDSQLLRLPRDLAAYLESGWYDDDRQDPMTVEYVGDERIGAWICHKLKCDLQNNYFYVWLARDRNLLPVRHEWHEPNWHNVLPTSVQYVDELLEIGPGIWFPRKVVGLAFRKVSRDGLVASRLVLQWRRESTIEQMTLNPTPGEQLFSEIPITKGTEIFVRDELSRSLGSFESVSDGLIEISREKLRELILQAEQESRRDAATPDESQVAAPPPPRKRGVTATGRLLNRLDQMNRGDALFKDGWLHTIKLIVELGPDAVPELIEALDASDRDRMLRCLGFILRAIDDKRAVPALIRAIPKTLRRPGSDMALTAFDTELMKFARQHDLDDDDNRKHYSFGRPVREICGALERLTGQQFDEASLYHTFLSGHPPQRREKRQRYYGVAKSWADWWEANWSDFVDDDAYARVDLPPLRLASPPRSGELVKTTGQKSGLVLETIRNPDSLQVFYDLDTDRFADLPDERRAAGGSSGDLTGIITWARTKGFDLMATEYVPPGGGPAVFVLQGIDLKTWQLDADRWKRPWEAVTLDTIRESGQRIEGPLVQHDPGDPEKVADPRARASLFVVTGEGMPALLHVGVEVRDDQQKPGTFYRGDPELNPSGTRKGRRFAVVYFDEAEPQR